MHEDLIPPDNLEGVSDQELSRCKSEYDVVTALWNIGHDVRPLGMRDDLGVVRHAIEEWKPHVAFNLLEEFHGVAVYDQNVVSYLELMRQPYTGCNPRGLMLAHDKAIAKQILSYHRIRTPRFAPFPMGRRVQRPKRLDFPLLVKSMIEDASLGISQASIVTSDDKLKDRVAYIHEQIRSDAIAEHYIDGREFYVGILGNQRLQTFPVWEMLFAKLPEGVPRIATAKVKFDEEYQKKCGITTQAAEDLSPEKRDEIAALCKRVYRVLSMSGYARMDLRLAPDGRVFVLEANPNPNLEYGEDFAESAERVGISYDALVQRIVNLGLSYRAAWRV
jgi:D-alanine-D-alanine ligase